MDPLPTVWFAAISLLWLGYLLLEGFDLGVGMHMLISARGDIERRVMLNSIGPVWDGNEVWLVTAGAATFAAFPSWYASLLSTLYLPVTVLLLGLIFRAIGIEYRGKGGSRAWVRFWEYAIGIGSLIVAFCVGMLLALTTTGLPLDANGDRVGGAFAWFSWPGMLGGAAVVGFALVHAGTFLALKTDGSVRDKALRFVARWSPLLLLPLACWALLVQLRVGNDISWVVLLCAAAAGFAGWRCARRGREGWAFLGVAAFAVLGVASIFGAAYPVVLPSTLDHAYDLTVANASSGAYTLGVMSVVAAFGLPLVLAYQGWSYWVFRKRISGGQIPRAHAVVPAVRR